MGQVSAASLMTRLLYPYPQTSDQAEKAYKEHTPAYVEHSSVTKGSPIRKAPALLANISPGCEWFPVTEEKVLNHWSQLRREN